VNSFSLLLVLAPILYSSFEDFIHRSLLNVSEINQAWRLHLATVTVLPFFIFFNKDATAIFLSVLLCVLFYFKNKSHIARFTLESHYEALYHLLVLAFLIRSSILICSISFCYLLSSISAGFSKFSSPIWMQKRQAFLMYIMMPWLSRPLIIRVIQSIITRHCRIAPLFSCISAVVPALQVFTPFMIILGACLELPMKFNLILLGCGLSFQIGFPILLFLISGLGLIPYFYLIAVIIFFMQFSMILAGVDLSITPFYYTLALFLVAIYAFSALGFARKKYVDPIGPFLRRGPFHMFTERNLIGMIVPALNLSNMHVTYPYPFTVSATRSWVQSVTSAKFFSIYYSLMDAYLSDWANCRYGARPLGGL